MVRQKIVKKLKKQDDNDPSFVLIMLVLTFLLVAPSVSLYVSSSGDGPPVISSGTAGDIYPLAVASNPQAFALVSSVGDVPTIDGNISAGEWDAARSDAVTLSGVEYFTVYSMVAGDYLFVAVRLNATNTDNTLDDNDLCDILFDVDLGRTDSPQGGDLKVECRYSSSSGASSSLEAGWGGSWISQLWPSDWMTALSNGSGEQIYEFRINLTGSNTVFQSLTSGNITGFGVYVKEQGPGSTAAMYWPDDINPSSNLEDIPAQWGSLMYKNPEIKINRVFYKGSGFNERIYIYNNASTDIRLENLTLRNSAGLTIPVPRITLPPGRTVRMVGCNGTNDTDFSDGYADFFVPSGEMWDDSGDYVWLGYSGNNCTADYMEYGSVSGAYPSDPSSSSGWIRDTSSLDSNAYYFLRRVDGYDKNRLSDWLAQNIPMVGKTLYLKTEGATDFMSTAPPISSSAESVTLAATDDEYRDWLSIPFARPFHILGNASLLLHVENNGNKVSGLNTTLFDSSGTALTFISNSTIIDLGVGTASGLRPVNITIPLIDYNISQNHSLLLRITATDVPGDGETPGPPETVEIYWNSTSNASYLYLPTDTYISVDNITYFNSGGSEWGGVRANESIEIFANISDPLGSYDISQAIVNITGPGTAVETGVTLLSADGSIPSAWKLFGTSFTPGLPGNYTVAITAVESNGVMDTEFIQIEAGENTSSPPVGDHIALFPDNPIEVNADSAEIKIHAVVINSTSGTPVSGVLINWSVADFDTVRNIDTAFLYRNSSITNDTGEATVILYTGHRAGDNWKVTANANGTTNKTAEIRVVSGRPCDITAVSGDGQSDTVGSYLPEPFVAEVDDRWGNSVGSGWPVWFNITDTGLNRDAMLEFPSPVLTSAQGMVENRLTLDTAPGTNIVTAEISGAGTKTGEFTATGTAPHLALIAGSTAASIPPGAVFNYTLYLDNGGDDTAENISVVWQIPEYLTYVSGSHDSTLSITAGNYTWSLASMEPGSLFIMDMSVQVNSDAPDGSISATFLAYYGDRLGHAYNSPSNTVNISVNSTAGGSPPHISEVPPLVVHYDAAYTFDLSPYIWDNDTPLQDLTLSFSDPVHAWQGNGTLRMMLLYPEKYNGMQIPLTIVVSDGTGSDYQTVMVYVTSDYPPELVEPIPDVTYYEDTVVYPFNVTRYFTDPDNDSLVYTYGEVHVICNILPNGTVRFTADENWFGEEYVTFRATDPTNALVEYTILVTVIPVNDPPVISSIPSLEIRMGAKMTVDLSQYISDPDNTLSELTLSTNSSFASVSGLNITLLYKNKLTSDTIYLTVSDGNATASSAVQVIIIQPTIWEKIYWPYPLLLLLLPILAGLYIYTRVKVEQVFFIYNDGVLIAHETIEDRETMDKDLFSSMLTAIQDFVKDSFTGEGGKGMRLKKLEFGERKIFLERAENAFLAIVYRGKISRPVERRAHKAISKIRESYAEPLSDWDGDMAKFEGINYILFEILK